METGYDQVLRSVAQVKIANQIRDSGDGDQDEDGVKVSCFTEVFDDVTIQFQIIRLAKQIYVWVGCNSAKFGNLYAAASTRPSNTVSVTSILGGTSDNTGSGIARRLVLKTGLNIILACNIPKNNPLLEAKAEKVLMRKLIDLGYTMEKACRTLNFQHAALSAQSPLVMATAVKKTVRVAAVQMTSVNDLMANFATCSRLVQEAVSEGAKLICFPENFSYVGEKEGDSVKAAEPLYGPIMQRYCSLARDSNIWLSLGGFQERFDDTHLCNTHVVIDDTGMIQSTYQKMHLFDVDVPGGSTYKESSFTVPGTNIVSVDSPVGRLGLTVCYDLRFPKIYQQLRFDQKAQVLLVPSAFTKVTGEAHWEVLLRARAIETQCYVIAAAQAGRHNEKRESYGDTLIIDPWGSVVGRLPDRVSTGIVVADIDFSLIDSVRTKMPIDKQRVSIDL